MGAKFVFYQVDIADFKSLDDVVRQCITRFGKINGLIHTAGIAHGDLAQFKSKSKAQDVFSPKIYGTYNLIKALSYLSLDFVVLKSSLLSLTGRYDITTSGHLSILVISIYR